MPKILLLTHGSEGDVRPLLEIGQALGARGNSVVCITHCAFEQLAREAGLEFSSFDTAGEYERMLSEIRRAVTPVELFRQFEQYNLAKYPVKYRLIREHYSAGNTVLIANSITITLAQIVAEKLGLPLVAIYLS